MPKGFGKGRDHGRSSRTSFPPLPPPPPRLLPGGAGPPGPAERQLTWRVSCALNGGAGGADGGGGGRRRRGAGCRLGPLCGGGSGAWPRRGALFRPGLCPPAAGEKAESGGGWARWGRGCPPRLPPPQADRLGGTFPHTRMASHRLAPRVGRGSRTGSAFLPATAPPSHKRQESTGLGQRSQPFSKQGNWGRQEQIIRLQQAGQHPRAFTSPRELSFFEGKAGSSRLEVSMQGTGQT